MSNTEEFEEFWEKISARTTYRVKAKRKKIIKRAEEKEYFLDHLYAVKNKQKTDFDHVVFDAGPDGPERKFVELLDSRDDIKLFMKLPPKFRIDTPVGPYNPDWAIIKHEDGEDRIYMIRETKSTMDESKRRPSENAKIKAA